MNGHVKVVKALLERAQSAKLVSETRVNFSLTYLDQVNYKLHKCNICYNF